MAWVCHGMCELAFRVSTKVSERKHMQCLTYFLAVNFNTQNLTHDHTKINEHVLIIKFSKQCYPKHGHHYYKHSLEPNFLISDAVYTHITQRTGTLYVCCSCDSKH
jgi:hypothetical protein